jgi:hypothetical protein
VISQNALPVPAEIRLFPVFSDFLPIRANLASDANV